MEYKEIVAVTGLGGLFQLLATKSDGAIVRNLADQSTKFISARLHNITPLESIEVYTTGDNVRLHNIFQKMQENESSLPLADPKKSDPAAIRSYFKSAYPELDEERVYISDMKKMLRWYEILKQNDLLKFEHYTQEEADNAAAEEVTDSPAEEEASAKPAKKARAKKATAPAEEGAEKPVKKAVAKKKKAEEPGTEEAKAPKKTAAKKKD